VNRAPSGVHKAVRWHPPSYDIRVEEIPVPEYAPFQYIAGNRCSRSPFLVHRIQQPDDAIVKVTVSLNVIYFPDAICPEPIGFYSSLPSVVGRLSSS